MAWSLPHTGMATAIDIGIETDIDRKNRQDMAHGLALAAAKIVYGENIVYSGPTYKSMRIERSRLRVTFTNVGTGLRARDKGGYVHGFSLASADGKFVWPQAQVDGADVIVSSAAVQGPSQCVTTGATRRMEISSTMKVCLQCRSERTRRRALWTYAELRSARYPNATRSRRRREPEGHRFIRSRSGYVRLCFVLGE